MITVLLNPLLVYAEANSNFEIKGSLKFTQILTYSDTVGYTAANGERWALLPYSDVSIAQKEIRLLKLRDEMNGRTIGDFFTENFETITGDNRSSYNEAVEAVINGNLEWKYNAWRASLTVTVPAHADKASYAYSKFHNDIVGVLPNEADLTKERLKHVVHAIFFYTYVEELNTEISKWTTTNIYSGNTLSNSVISTLNNLKYLTEARELFLTEELKSAINRLPMFGNVSQVTDIITAVDVRLAEIQGNFIVGVTDQKIEEKYTSKVTKDSVVRYSSYSDVLNTMYAFSVDLSKSPILKYFGGATQKEALDLYWGRVLEADAFTNEQLQQLQYPILGRGSVFSIGKYSPIAIPLVYENENRSSDLAAQQAAEQLSFISQTIQRMPTAIVDRRDVTISYRAQYHYYAMQTNLPLDFTIQDMVRGLTRYDNGQMPREFGPVKIPDIVVNPLEYMHFMDVLNEIPVMRMLLIESGALKELGTDTAIKEGYQADLRKLRQLKGTITFLESLPHEDLAEITNYWYKTDSEGRSLESIYRATLNIAIDDYAGETEEISDEDRPLLYLFDESTNKINNNFIKMGIAQSATYKPLQTNVYEVRAFDRITNPNFYTEFHEVWGHYRKALFIDSRSRAAIAVHNTGKKGKLRVATLADLLNPDSEIVLYSDSSFYNLKQLQELQNRYLKNEIQENQSGFWEAAAQDNIRDLYSWAKDPMSVATEKVMEGLTTFGDSIKEGFKALEGSKDEVVLSGTQINEYLRQREYTPFKALAVQSAIMRDKQVANFVKKTQGYPVFVASKTLSTLSTASKKDVNSYYNYLLLKNIENNLRIEFRTAVDFSAPVYLDVYGNIVTESGYVVVPSIANGTIFEDYHVYTTAFLTSYGTEYKASEEEGKIAMSAISNVVEVVDGFYEIQNLVEGDVINMQRLSTNSEKTRARIYTLARDHVENASMDRQNYVTNILLSVMRGAPVYLIDKVEESLQTSNRINPMGVAMAAKLEELKLSLNTTRQNSLLSIPSIIFNPQLDVIMMFLFKITMIGLVIILLMQAYTMGMKGTFSVASVGKIIGTIFLTFAMMFTVPLIYEVSYYYSNRALLQNETLQITLLNSEKRSNGIEVSMTEVGEPTNQSQLLLKMQDIDIPWYELFVRVSTSSITEGVQGLYEEYASSTTAHNVEDFIARGSGLYVDVKDVMDSTQVLYSPAFHMLTQQTTQETPASFFMPYYVFLDKLIYEMNMYNSKEGYYDYSTGVYEGGRLKTIGLSKGYLTSVDFMENKGKDPLGLYTIYGVQTERDSFFTEDQLEVMRKSYWANTDLSYQEVEKRVEHLNVKALEFVSRNLELVGRISDESFLKVMALNLAMEHNKLFGVNSAQTLEVYNVTSDDLLRFSIAKPDRVMGLSPYSYSRFVFEASGVVGVVLATILELILFLTGWIKPAVTIILFVAMYLSIFIYRLVLRKENDNVKGYVKLSIIMVLVNVLYAGTLKLSLMLPRLNMNPSVSLFFMILTQLVFLFFFIGMGVLAIANWKDLGSSRVDRARMEIVEFVSGNSIVRRKIDMRNNPTTKGWNRYKLLHDKDKQRVYRILQEKEI
jgi:hypothetical protein